MKKIILILILVLLAVFLKPSYITVNKQQTNACTIDIQKDNTLICD